MSRLLLENEDDAHESLTALSFTYSEGTATIVAPQGLTALSTTYSEGTAFLSAVVGAGQVSIQVIS